MLNSQFRIIVSNSFQNIGQADLSRANELGNLSIERPTVEEMNIAIAGDNALCTIGEKEVTPVEPAFGEHLREAANALRRIVR